MWPRSHHRVYLVDTFVTFRDNDPEEDHMAEPGSIEREDEDDHDLLTYGEAGFRLHEAVREQRELVEGRVAAGDDAGAAVARARLEAFESAVERNRRQPINDENFEKFFGYPGEARRNT